MPLRGDCWFTVGLHRNEKISRLESQTHEVRHLCGDLCGEVAGWSGPRTKQCIVRWMGILVESYLLMVGRNPAVAPVELGRISYFFHKVS